MYSKKDFYYELPDTLIAQTPLMQRDRSRMMVLDRNTGAVEHRHFYEIGQFLQPGDCLILNDTRVLPARLYGEKAGTGTIVEFLLLTQREADVWEALTGPGRRAKPGTRFSFGGGLLECEVLQVLEGGNRLIRFAKTDDFWGILEQIGEMPLPHYIKERLGDRERYQTVYAREPGSAAAPTAGLHFTPALLEELKGRGVAVGFVTLHVGLGTFRPVQAEKIQEHTMHAEHYHISRETADLILSTQKKGGRIIAVGTTSCRTLESVAAKYGRICEAEGWTNIFIYPGYHFQVLDGLITNFHLPESTLIMLVSAFAGYAHTMEAYRCAVREKYRFFSFGDTMLIQ